jgi:hypothetical protein
MRRRKLVITLAAAAMFGFLVVPASAELHRVTVTLVTGQTMTLTVDVPPGASVESIEIPGLPAPVQSIVDHGPVATPTPDPTATATPDQTATPTPTEPPSGNNQGQDGALAPARGNKGGDKSKGDKQTPSQSDPTTLDPNAEALNGQLQEETKKTEPQVDESNPTRNTDGSPTLDNPTLSLATPGPARIGVPNFFIEKFRIPPFLLPIYQAAGIEYGVRWEVLAAINEIETDYGRNLNVSSAGALGWMQFMPASWELYGVDGNQDGLKDPYNPVDAIFAAARYLKAAGAETDLRAAIFAYNHADWYVDSVILRARYIGGLPADLVGSLSGLTQGRFPVQAKASYAKDVRRTAAADGSNPAYVVESSDHRNGIKIFAKRGAPVVAVNDGRIVDTGHSRRLGNFVTLQDVYGNTYTYGHLKSVVESYPTPKPKAVDDKAVRRELKLPPADTAPKAPASATTKADLSARKQAKKAEKRKARKPAKERRAARGEVAPAKERLFANPDRPNSAAAGGDQQKYTLSEDFGAYLNRVFGLDRTEVDMKPLKRGARVTAGTVLGRIGKISKRTAPHLLFEIRPAGRGAPRIDPKPILDGWKLLESTAIYRAANRNPFHGKDAQTQSIGQILLMSKEALAARVLANPNIQIYDCGRQDIQTGQIDRRVLATLEFLVASGLKPTVTSLRCGHSFYTASGNVSEHTTGTAVDIAAINGIPILGHQGQGSVTELAIQRLLTLQGTMKPHQIISLMEFQGTDNTIAMADHADHIHVGFRPLYGANEKTAKQVDAILKPEQWIKLIDRLDEIDNPTVASKPSKYAVEADKRASPAHKGE